MRKLSSWLLPVLIIGVLGGVAWRYNETHHGPSALPSITLSSLTGKPVNLRHLSGQPVILNIWATWCPPCRAELPLLIKASETHQNIRFLFAEQGDSESKVTTYADKIGLPPSAVLLDSETRLSKFFGIVGYPTTVFYRTNGSILTIHKGELTSSTLSRILKQLS